MKRHVITVHEKNSCSNATFATTPVLKRITLLDMLQESMKQKNIDILEYKNHSNVAFVNTVVLEKVAWKHMLHQFIKERSHSTVIFVMLRFLITVIWRGMFLEFMKEVNSELSWINFKYLQTIFWFTLFWMFEYFWGWHENYQTKLRNTNYIEIKKRRLFLLLEADFFPWFKTFPEMSLNFCKSRISW